MANNFTQCIHSFWVRKIKRVWWTILIAMSDAMVFRIFLIFKKMFGGTGVWTQGLVLARKLFIAWAMLPA
jgi:hypothetical protein